MNASIHSHHVTRGTVFALAVLLLAPVAPAEPGAASSHYTTLPLAIGGGGGSATSDNYEDFAAVEGSVTGSAFSEFYRTRLGFNASAGPLGVTGRHIFYNQSSWDGNNAGANADDDHAIAPDKQALLPGEKASFANYTSFQRGINGVMIDLPLEDNPTAGDFAFHRGNSSNPADWVAAPDPSTIAVRPGAGHGGADRVTLIWPSGSITKQWLRIVVRRTANTGLSEPDVFYFGNAIGETGNTAADARVTAADALRVLGKVTPSAAIDNIADINRDGRVGAADRLLVMANLSALDPLLLLNLGGGPALAFTRRPEAAEVPVEVSRDPRGLRIRWVSDGAAVSILTADALESANWEPLDVVGAGARAGDVVETILPAAADGAARFYRFESRRY